jgi:serine/threonine protein phosphatase PrpC
VKISQADINSWKPKDKDEDV